MEGLGGWHRACAKGLQAEDCGREQVNCACLCGAREVPDTSSPTPRGEMNKQLPRGCTNNSCFCNLPIVCIGGKSSLPCRSQCNPELSMVTAFVVKWTSGIPGTNAVLQCLGWLRGYQELCVHLPEKVILLIPGQASPVLAETTKCNGFLKFRVCSEKAWLDWAYHWVAPHDSGVWVVSSTAQGAPCNCRLSEPCMKARYQVSLQY